MEKWKGGWYCFPQFAPFSLPCHASLWGQTCHHLPDFGLWPMGLGGTKRCASSEQKLPEVCVFPRTFCPPLWQKETQRMRDNMTQSATRARPKPAEPQSVGMRREREKERFVVVSFKSFGEYYYRSASWLMHLGTAGLEQTSQRVSASVSIVSKSRWDWLKPRAHRYLYWRMLCFKSIRSPGPAV